MSAWTPIRARLARLTAVVVTIAAATGCGNDHRLATQVEPDASVPEVCTEHPDTFVRQAFLALDGRRPRSQAETDVYVDLYKAAAAGGADPKAAVARALMARPEFSEQWIDVLMDSLHVQRVDIQNEAGCWQEGARTQVTSTLAASVRDQAASTAGDGQGAWTMLDLARSSLVLDDVTPLYRAQLFSLVAHPIPAANVPDLEAELARREDFGTTFDAAYLHRDIVCLGCHTSERSVTDSPDPAADRFWPVPGAPEEAVYGDPAGTAPARAHAAFRYTGLVREQPGGAHPWGWSASCGGFNAPGGLAPDPAGVDAKLGSVVGTRATVYDLERALARGFVALRTSGPPVEGVPIDDPDAALAWLVTLKMAEDLWRTTTGSPLTIANYFPRNRAASELLAHLAGTLVTSNYSLRTALVEVVTSDYFDLSAPADGCSPHAYPLANVFDPWVIADPSEARRHNGPGDSVQPVPARALVTAVNAALEWTPPPDASRFPDYGEDCGGLTCAEIGQYCSQFGACCITKQAVCLHGGASPTTELPFQRSVGMFLRNSERGFAGLDFQGRLAWEDRYGACARPTWVREDAIDRLVAAGAAAPTATVSDVIAVVKDRLVGEPTIATPAERTALESIVGPLDAPATAATVPAVRQVCAALLASPQFLLRGIAGKGGDRPVLTPATSDYAAVCAEVAATGLGATTGLGLPSCESGVLTLAAP